jgi:hypothetical protein
MKTFLNNLLAGIHAFFASNQAHSVEQAVVAASAPVIEAAILDASKANPIASVVVSTVVIPAITSEVASIEKPKS